jgi:hypothetical protein
MVAKPTLGERPRPRPSRAAPAPAPMPVPTPGGAMPSRAMAEAALAGSAHSCSSVGRPRQHRTEPQGPCPRPLAGVARRQASPARVEGREPRRRRAAVPPGAPQARAGQPCHRGTTGPRAPRAHAHAPSRSRAPRALVGQPDRRRGAASHAAAPPLPGQRTRRAPRGPRVRADGAACHTPPGRVPHAAGPCLRMGAAPALVQAEAMRRLDQGRRGRAGAELPRPRPADRAQQSRRGRAPAAKTRPRTATNTEGRVQATGIRPVTPWRRLLLVEVREDHPNHSLRHRWTIWPYGSLPPSAWAPMTGCMGHFWLVT